MLIWGSKGKQELVSNGQFFCPHCNTTQAYKLIRITRYFTLFHMPLFKTKDLGEMVECKVCINRYKPSILEPGNQRMHKIVATTKSSLLHGISLDEVKTRLIVSGADDETADKIIAMAKII